MARSDWGEREREGELGREEVLYALLGVDWGADGEVEEGPKVGEEGEEAEVDVGVAVGMEGVDGTEEKEEEDRGGGEGEEEGEPAAFLSLEGSRVSSGGVVSAIGESFFMDVCLDGITTSVLHSAREALPIELELASLSEEVEALRSMVPSKGIGMDCARNGRP